MIKKIQSFAKINLLLYITSKRSDGYHNLCSIITQIDLYDDIYIEFAKESISITCDHPDVPNNESNIAYKAAALFFRSLKKMNREKGFSIKIIKRIPPGGGLGGGSSNAAAVLTALNHYYKNPYSKSQLMEMGLSLGADVPFFLFNNPAIARGVGEKLEKIKALKPYHLVLCDPGVQASTAKVYKNIDFKLTTNQKYNINTGLSVLLRGVDFDVRDIMHNDLEESACRLYPEIRKTKEEMELLLERKVYMTGSGSSLFALFTEHENAKKGYEKLLSKWNKSKKKVFLSSFKQSL
ncbi:MAG: 4-(cytidine 5'-diphospho)-2-C-methyl-D-erythritol kinase [Thermodesulfobacteriota bacterium]